MSPRTGLRLALGLGALFLGGAALLALVTHGQLASEKARLEAKRAAWQTDTPLIDAARARMLARSGLDTALVELRDHLRAGVAPPARCARNVGASYTAGADLFEVAIEPRGGGGFTLACEGTVRRSNLGPDGRETIEVLATARLRAEVLVDATGWKVQRTEGP